MKLIKEPFLMDSRVRAVAGFAALLSISIFFAFAIKSMGVKGGALIIIALVGPVFAYAVIAYPKFGVLSLIILSYFILWIMKLGLTTFPLGTVMDGLLALLLVGLIIHLKYNPDWSYFRNPVGILIIIWIAYNFLEVINPSAASRLAWVYTIRSLAIIMLSYFVFVYHIRSIAFVRTIIKIWLGMSIFAAFYGLKQQFIGFTAFEEEFLYSDPMITDLLFINGEWRKFSIYADPVVFSYNMIISSIICVGLMFRPIPFYQKLGLAALIFIFLFNMLISGTRSAYLLIPASLFMLMILKFNKKLLFYAGVAGFVLAFIVLMPTSSPRIYRFQSAFKPSNDASFNVRAINQKRIQPYIQTHPMGGGLGSTGVWGGKFSPGSFLASFPPDSGYVRVAVEMGWIGLLLFCILVFTILKTGINNYYKIKDPELKTYCLMMVLIVYVIAIGNYPQEAITQYPSNVIFFLVAALITTTYNLDQQKSAEEAAQAREAKDARQIH